MEMKCRKQVDTQGRGNHSLGKCKDFTETRFRKELASKQGAKEESSVGQGTGITAFMAPLKEKGKMQQSKECHPVPRRGAP